MTYFLIGLSIHSTLGSLWTWLYAMPKIKEAGAPMPGIRRMGTILSNTMAWPIQIIRWKFFGYLTRVF